MLNTFFVKLGLFLFPLWYWYYLFVLGDLLFPFVVHVRRFLIHLQLFLYLLGDCILLLKTVFDCLKHMLRFLYHAEELFCYLSLSD